MSGSIKKNMKYTLIIIAILISFTLYGGVQADEVDYSIMLENPSGVQTIPDLLNKVIEFLNLLLGPLLVIMILWGAFKMLSSQGNETAFAEGKKIIEYAVIGAIVILTANGIVLIIKEILEVTNI